MKKYQFYGWEQADVPATSKTYEKIKNPKELYDKLSEIWCADTCAPRMRERWSKENQTLGQCSITAFLAQDIFGGKVYGILRPGGNYHCYNVVGDCCFDLTSEQFGDEILDYRENPEQFREICFQFFFQILVSLPFLFFLEMYLAELLRILSVIKNFIAKLFACQINDMYKNGL